MRSSQSLIRSIAVVSLALNLGVAGLFVSNNADASRKKDPNAPTCTNVKKGQSFWWEYKNNLGQTISGQVTMAQSDLKLCRK